MELENGYLISNESNHDLHSKIQISGHANPDNSLYKSRKRINLIIISAFVCGVEIVASCAYTYIPPLLLRSGFSELVMNIMLGIAPLVAMITVPVLAEWSDNVSHPCGKRCPLILGYSSILIGALVLVPFNSEIAALIGGDLESNFHMYILAVGVILLDYSLQAIYNPFEALLSDLMTTFDKGSQSLGFSVFSASLSLGCIIGYLTVCVKWTSIIPLDLYQDQMCFVIVTFLFIPCIFLMFLNKEVPTQFHTRLRTLDDQSVNNKNNTGASYVSNCIAYGCHLKNGLYSKQQGSGHNIGKKMVCTEVVTYISLHLFKLLAAILLLGYQALKKILLLPFGCYTRIQRSSTVIRRVFLFEIFGWIAVHCHNRFFTDFVGQYLYEGDPNAEKDSAKAILYDEGIQIGSWCLFLQSVAACLYAFFIQQHLMNYVGQRAAFLGGICVLFLSMVFTVALPSVTCLKITTAISGVGMATLTTTPTMLVTLYFKNKSIYMKGVTDLDKDEELLSLSSTSTERGIETSSMGQMERGTDTSSTSTSSSTERGIGAQVAVLDMAYYLSQIILSFFLGPLIEVFRSSVFYMVVAVVASGGALYCASRVVFEPHHVVLVREGRF